MTWFEVPASVGTSPKRHPLNFPREFRLRCQPDPCPRRTGLAPLLSAMLGICGGTTVRQQGLDRAKEENGM